MAVCSKHSCTCAFLLLLTSFCQLYVMKICVRLLITVDTIVNPSLELWLSITNFRK